jgi:cell pole-organizing protein PopZ
MSASNSPVSALPGAADPSMEDILASIRRILNEDEAAAATAGPPPPVAKVAAVPPPEDDGVLVLDNSMMIGAPAPPPPPEPVMPPLMAMPMPAFALHDAEADGIIAPESEAAAAASVGSLLRTLSAERHTEVHRGGPTVEDLVREGIRPLLKSWLDVHLPPLVERLVRAEIERIGERAAL